MPHPGPVATGALQPSPHCDQASIPGASQEGSMATPGPGGGFHPSPLATQPAALKGDFILKSLKRTEMLHVGACSGGGYGRGGLFFFSIQDALRWGGGAPVVSACLSVGLRVYLRDTKRGPWVCVHHNAKMQAWDPGPHSWRAANGRFPCCTWASRPARAGAGGVKALLPGRMAQRWFLLKPLGLWNPSLPSK